MENKRIYTVYMHKNKINNKRYIGITKRSVKERWGNGNNYKTCSFFNNAIQKYGWDNFEHRILFSKLTKNQAAKLEVRLIKKYQSNNPKYGYNLESGGFNGKTTDKRTKDKISEQNRGKSKNHKAKIINVTTGEIFETQLQAAKRYNTSQPEIFRACTKQQQTCKGCVWEFIFDDDYVFKDPREHALSFGCYGELYENPKYHERIIRYFIEDYLGLNIYDDL